MSYLCLVRHGESEWNALARWTGRTDIPLSEQGKLQSKEVGRRLKDFTFHIAYTSALLRATQTLDILKGFLFNNSFESIADPALNERDYGDFTGKNKWDLQKQFGKEEFHKIRRGWNHPIPNGDTLKDVYERVIPFYTSHVVPFLKENKNVLIVAHGNSLRALMKYIENIKDSDIDKLNIATGEICVYNMNNEGNVISKNTLKYE